MNWQVHTNIWGRLAPLADGWSPAEKRINRIYYIHSGEGYYEIDGTTYPFEHNKLYILPDTVRILVSQSYDDPMDHTFFDFEMIPGFSFHHVIGIDVDQYPMIKAQMDVFQKLIDCYDNNCTYLWSQEVLDVVNAMIPCLLWMISHIEILSVTNDTRILETLHYIHNNLDKAVTVEDLAARIFLDKNYFIRLFTKNTGQTPHSYIRSQRLNRAMTLLQKGIPAKNVSEQCGYDSYCAFSRAFKSHYGYPPTFYQGNLLYPPPLPIKIKTE